MWSLQPSNWPLAKYWTNGGGAYIAFKNEWSVWILVKSQQAIITLSNLLRSVGAEQQLQLWVPSSMRSAAMTVLRTWPLARSTTPSTTTGTPSPPWAQSAHALALPRSMVSCTAAVATTAPPASQALRGSTLLLGSGHLALPWALEGAIAGGLAICKRLSYVKCKIWIKGGCPWQLPLRLGRVRLDQLPEQCGEARPSCGQVGLRAKVEFCFPRIPRTSKES